MKRFALLLIPVICWAANTSVTVDQLIAMARSAPGEFAAEALIRIAGIDKVDKPRKITLLEEAFSRAGEAQLPYKRRSSITRIPGASGVFNRIYSQDLDAMSLRRKALLALLPLDPQKARALFLRIPPLKLPRLTCADYLVYDVDSFYEVMERVASQSYTSAEIDKGESFRFLLPYASSVDSPMQLPVMARLIAASNVSDKDFQALTAAFAKAMSKISADDRSFTYAAVGPQIRALVQAAQKRQISPLPLVEAYRLYIVNHMSAARCADDDLMANEATSFGFVDPRLEEQQGSDPAVYFNGHLRMPPLQDIQETEVTPSKIEGVAEGLRGCDYDACKSMVQLYSDLIFDDRHLPYPPARKLSEKWQRQFQDLLTAMAAWKPQGPTFAAEHFREKCALYSDVASIAPTGPSRETVLRAELEFVLKNKAAAENRVQWFLPVNALIGRVTLDPLGLGKLTDDLRNAADPIITLFVELDLVAPRTPDRIMSLI